MILFVRVMLLLSTLIREGFSQNTIFLLFSSLFVVFCTLPVHEMAHAFIAYKLGDNTAKNMGRLTMDPFKHLDWFGSVLIVLFGFGWAKPVPVNPANFKNPKKGMALTALAGPISNLLMAFLFMLIANGIGLIPATQDTIYYINMIYLFLFYAAVINITLAVFNLIPVPPLDGSRLLCAFLPDRLYFKVMQYERYFMLVILLLLITGVLDIPINFLSDLLLRGIVYLANLPFAFFR